MTADELADLFGDGLILAMRLHLPPLYYKDWAGNQQRIYTPPAATRADLRSVVYARDGFICQSCRVWFGDGVPGRV